MDSTSSNFDTPFLIWNLNKFDPNSSDPGTLQVRPEVVSQFANILYATFPQSIRPVTVEGYQIVDILGGVEICPATFNPQTLLKVDRITHEFTPEQVTLLRTLVENLILQSARSCDSLALNTYLKKNGLTMKSFLRLVRDEVYRVVNPSMIDLLLSTTQPQSLSLSYNSGVIKDTLCHVNGQLPIIIFSASLLERITKSISNNSTLAPALKNMSTYLKTYQDPLLKSTRDLTTSSSNSLTTSNLLMWIITIILIIIIVGLIYLVTRK